MISESSEFPPNSKIENLAGEYVDAAGKDSIQVAADVLGTNQWEEMVHQTQSDLRERGLIIARKRNGSCTESKVFSSEGPEAEKSIEIPLSQVLKSLVPGRSNLTFIHTHPMPPSVDHLHTTVFSDEDLQEFLKTDFKALVMLDRGGAHLVVPTSGFAKNMQPFKPGLVAETVEKIKQENGGTLDVVRRVSDVLAGRGFGYFYTPELHHAQGAPVTFYRQKAIPNL